MSGTIGINGKGQRMLAACIAAICAGSASAMPATLHAPEAAVAGAPRAPANVVVTNCNDSGPGSLRDAISNAATGDTIDLTQLGCSTITLTTGTIVIAQSNLSLLGPGRFGLTIDGSGYHGESVFYDVGDEALTISDLTVTGGSKYEFGEDARGGCIYGAGNVIVEYSAISGCGVEANGAGAFGGGVFARGRVYLLNSTVALDHARSPGYTDGGGVYAQGGLVAKYSTIAENYAYAEFATTSFGGGVFAHGTVLIEECTISYNSAGRMGGLALADTTGQTATISNSTISGNTAGEIGGLFVRPPLQIYNSTVAFNSASYWTDGTHDFAAGLYLASSAVMDSTIVANNVNINAPYATADLTGAGGVIISGGHNDVMFCGVGCPPDTSNGDPGLHPLTDNGGPTRTLLPTPGSWEASGGSNVLNLAWDQRGIGFSRQPTGYFPDIGAVQVGSDIIFVNGFN